jgi:adenosylcobyric acid synthase
MVQGASSSAGKSLVVTALARWFARRGVRVAPFKAQNMSNNARVAEGGEIGAAQWLQARAAGVEPDVRMNPVLVKPEADTRSQVIVRGRPDIALSALAWQQRAAPLWPIVQDSLDALLEEYELVLLEGAGSPAEINLRSIDLANMRSAHAADAPVLLVADIDRGGAFAHLYGTWRLLDRQDRRLVRGFLLNKFRGDAALLHPAPELLCRRTGVSTLGVLPWLEHGLPDEDGAAVPAVTGRRTRVAIVRYPTASNLDEYRTLEQVADVEWAGSPVELQGADLVILPGSKHVAADREWLRARGFDGAIRRRVASGGRVLAVCGGLQLLGERFDDPDNVDGAGHGLGLLPLRTSFAAEKLARRTVASFGELPDPWRALSGLEVEGYEIRHGSTQPLAPLQEALPGGLGYVAGPMLAVYVHGVCEQPSLVDALVGEIPARTLDNVFDQLADALDEHVDMKTVARLAGVA